MIVPKCLRGDGIVGWSGTLATVAARNFGSEVYSRIRCAYSASGAWARAGDAARSKRAEQHAIDVFTDIGLRILKITFNPGAVGIVAPAQRVFCLPAITEGYLP